MRSAIWRVLAAASLALGLAAPAAAQGGPEKKGGEEKENPQAIYKKALDDLTAGKLDEAVAGFKKVVEAFPDEPEPRYNYACALSRKGDVKTALAELEKAIDLGFDDADHMKKDTDLENLRKDPAWNDLLARKLGPKPAPELALKDWDGKPVALSAYRGKVVILDFWATWCGWCKKEIPHLRELQEQWGPKGLEIVGVSDEGKELQAPFAKEQKMSWTLLVGPEQVPAAWGVEGLPTTFILDQEGKIVRKFVGYREKAVFEEVLATLLGAPEKKGPAEPPAPKGEDKPKGKTF